jgi:hypothetical protein
MFDFLAPLKMPLDHGPTVGCGYYSRLFFLTLPLYSWSRDGEAVEGWMVPVGGTGRRPLKESIPCPLCPEPLFGFQFRAPSPVPLPFMFMHGPSV